MDTRCDALACQMRPAILLALMAIATIPVAHATVDEVNQPGVAVFRVQTTVAPGSYTKIADALRAAVAYRHAHAGAPIRVEIAAGDYYLDAPLKLGPELSGDEAHPTEIVAASAKNPPRLIAGRRLTLHWEPYRAGILQAKLPDTTSFDQLYVDGKAQVRARYPNLDPNAVLGGYAADAVSPERIARWKDPGGGVLQALHERRWGGMQVPILGKNADGTLLFGKEVGNNRPSSPNATYRYVENVFEELDAPNEWYFDARRAILYWMPPPGVDASKAQFEVSGAMRVFDLQGTASRPLRHVRVAGLRIEHTGTSFLRATEPLVRSDWMVAREGAIFIENSEDVRIENDEFADLGGTAVFVSGRNRRAIVAHNHIHDIGGGGINFIGHTDAARSPSFVYEDFVPIESIDRTPGPKSDDYPSDSVAEDNLIHHVGLIEKQLSGVGISLAMRIRVSHNSIYDVPRAGINVGDGTWGGHLIEYNDVFNTVLETGDHGAFNSWGRDRHWHPDRAVMDRINAADPTLWKLDVVEPITLAHNRFRCDHGWDIDLDDGSSNYRIHDNVLLAGGLKFREGFSREAWNNVLVNNSFHPHVWFAGSRDMFEHNIVMASYQPIQVEHWDASIDYNLFPTQRSLDLARKLGLDAHSNFGDPRFLDAAGGDFRVAETSPALAVGFRNFPMDAFGVSDPSLRALAESAPIPDLASAAETQPEKRYPFLGAEVKTVTSAGEQSAAGLPAIKGVVALLVPECSAAAKSGLRQGDVIIESPPPEGSGADVESIDNVQDLLRLSAARAWRGALDVIVMREQKRLTITLKTAQN